MGILSKVIGLSPYIEVIVRRIYWRSPLLIELASKRRPRKKAKMPTIKDDAFENILDFFRRNGVGSGSLIVVHSSAESLQPTGKSPGQVIDELIKLIGPDGTLAMPAFPNYKDEPTGISRMTADVSNLVLTYDVKKSVPWTGKIPYTLMKYPNAVRSQHPLNTMVALGPLALPMMENNLLGERPFPCGENSSWNFCAGHGAKIIALGVDMAHSLTMIHVAEDAYADTWPVSGWYRDRKFIVVDKGERKEVVVRERHPKWAKHFAERTLSKDLKKNSLLISEVIDGVLVEILDAGALMRFLNKRKETAYPYFMVPSKNREI